MTVSGSPLSGPTSTPREDFRLAGVAFLDLVRQVPRAAWDAPGLGVWTVRELVGHAARSLTTVVDYLAAPPPDGAAQDGIGGPLVDAIGYFRLGRQAGVTNSDAVAERGRAAGRDLGADPAVAVAGLLDRALASVAAAPDDVVLVSRLAATRLVDYLPTRTFELVVHGLDLQTALGLPPHAPAAPLASMLAIVTGLALDQGLGPALLLALTGRAPLPDGVCVL